MNYENDLQNFANKYSLIYKKQEFLIGKIQEKLDSFITEVRITTDEIKESIKKHFYSENKVVFVFLLC